MDWRSLPDHVRVLTIDGVQYFIPWEDVRVGASFFIPTLATEQQVGNALRAAAKELFFDFQVASRCEQGVYGARIWRVN